MAVGQNQWYRFGVGAPPILEPILVGIGMVTGGTGFSPMVVSLSLPAAPAVSRPPEVGCN